MSPGGHVDFDADAMRSAAGTIEAIRTTVEAEATRVTSAPLRAMPPSVGAAVQAQLGSLRRSAQAASHDLQGVPVELRFRAFLADLADQGDKRGSAGINLPWARFGGLLLGGAADGLSRYAKYWTQWTHVNGYWRTLASGTRTWVRPFWRNLGRDIESHAGDVEKLRVAGRVFKVLSVVPDAIDVFKAFQAPSDKRTEEVGKASGNLGGGLAGAWAGGEAGAALGATIGSAFPVVGTVVGGVAGGIIGGAIGAFAGSEIGKRLGGAVAKPIVEGAKKVASVAGKAWGGAKKALSSLNPF